MFTGIIEEMGSLRKVLHSHDKSEISVSCSKVLQNAVIGDSIAVNGVCLTIVRFDSTGFEADVSSETWQRSNLQSLKPNALVNLESALALGGKLGGHFVQGHVDGTATVLSYQKRGDFYDFQCSLPTDLMTFLVEKGSLALNGISLTIARLDAESLSCAIIPHTWLTTNLHHLTAGDSVNIEIDILAKYVYNFVKHMPDDAKSPESNQPSIDKNFLSEHGFL